MSKMNNMRPKSALAKNPISAASSFKTGPGLRQFMFSALTGIHPEKNNVPAHFVLNRANYSGGLL